MANITMDSDIGKVPASTKDLLELSKLNKWLQIAERSKSEVLWREESEEDYKFYAGDQDTVDVKAILDSQHRPTTVYNEIKPKVDMLIGLAAQARQVPNLVAVGQEDEALTEVINGMLKFRRDKAKVSRKEMEAFAHMVKGGRAFLHPYMGGDNPFTPELKVKVIPGRDVHIDPDSVEYDLDDARFVFISKWYDADDIAAMYPEYDSAQVKNFSQTAIGANQPSYFNEGNDKYRLVEVWYRKYDTVIWFKNPLSGRTESLPPKDFAEFNKAIQQGMVLGDGQKIPAQQAINGVSKVKRQVYYAIFSGNIMLESGKSPHLHNKLPLVLFGAYKNEDENRWFGAVTMAKDPQRALNTTRRQLVHLLQVSPKGILVHEAGTILNIEEYEEKSSQPNFHLEVAKGGIEKFKFTTQPQISPVYGQLDQLFDQSIKNVIGTQDALLGIQTSSREPGVTMQMRQETGIAVLYIIFENFRQSRLLLAEIMLSLIQQYDNEETVVRVEGPEGVQLMQANSQMNPQAEGFNDLSFGEYDVRIDENVENVTMRAFAMQMLAQFGQNNPGTIPPDLLMEYSTLPYSAKQRVKIFNQQQMQMQQAAQDREFQLKVEELKIKKIAAENKGSTSSAPVKNKK